MPSTKEIEVSVFGIGYGESIICHIGNDEWIIIDSCINPDTGKAIALDYFEQNSIDKGQIKHIIASHWHDDHIRGMSQIFQQCLNAKFHCSAALRTPEFLQIVTLGKSINTQSPNGINELDKILSCIINRTDPFLSKPDFEIENRVIYSNDLVDLIALSPSSTAITDAMADILSLLPVENQTLTKIPNNNPNSTSVVVMIRIKQNNLCLLLGADLVNSTDTTKGWERICNIKPIPPYKVNVFKIPHHGSENSHNDRIWKEMMFGDKNGIITKFRLGNVDLPSLNHLNYLSIHTQNLYLTHAPNQKSLKVKRNKTVEKVLRNSGKQLRRRDLGIGHIKVTYNINKNTTRIESFGTALKYTNI